MERLEKSADTAAACPPFACVPLVFPEHEGAGPVMLLRLPNWLGDAVMTLPALKVLSAMMTSRGGRLVVIATPQSAELVKCLPQGMVHDTILISGAHRKWTAAETAAVREAGADCAVLFTNSLRDVLQLRHAGVRHISGARARMRQIFMSRSFVFPKRIRHRLNPPHHMHRYLAMAYALGAPEWDGTYPALTPQFPLEQTDRKIASLTEHPSLLLLAAGAAYGAGKRWPSSHYAAVAAHYISKGGIVAVLGSTSETVIGKEIVNGLPENKAFNLCGKTSFADLLYLMQSARAMVANDSGLMHLGAAVGVPGVAVFGPTDHAATGPVPSSGNWIVLTDPAPCSPCFHRTCSSGLCCIARVSPDAVIAELEKF